MTFGMTMVQLEQELSERKLSGKFMTFHAEISWDTYEKYVDTMHDYLINHHGLDIQRRDVLLHPEVVDSFEKLIIRELNNEVADQSYRMLNHLAKDQASAIFDKEIKESISRMNADSMKSISIDEANYSTAIAILQAAKLL